MGPDNIITFKVTTITCFLFRSFLIRESCEAVPREVCEPECRLVPRKVVDQDCTQEMVCKDQEKMVQREVCKPIERQECTPVSKKECEMQPVEKCKKVRILARKFKLLKCFR